MAAPNKSKSFPLSNLNDGRQLVLVDRASCKRTNHYVPSDQTQVLGDADLGSLITRMTCETSDDDGWMRVEAIYPSGKKAMGRKIRRLVLIKTRREPVWREE